MNDIDSTPRNPRNSEELRRDVVLRGEAVHVLAVAVVGAGEGLAGKLEDEGGGEEHHGTVYVCAATCVCGRAPMDASVAGREK